MKSVVDFRNLRRDKSDILFRQVLGTNSEKNLVCKLYEKSQFLEDGGGQTMVCQKTGCTYQLYQLFVNTRMKEKNSRANVAVTIVRRGSFLP